MGWLFGWETKESLVEHLLRQDNSNVDVIDHSLRGSNLWMLCRMKNATSGYPEGYKFITLCKLQFSPGAGPWDRDWGYKDIDESMGPVEMDCPEKFLSQSDDTSEFGTAWRARCRTWRRERRDRLKFIAGLKPGDKFLYGDLEIQFTRHLPWAKNYIAGIHNGTEFRWKKSKVRQPEEGS